MRRNTFSMFAVAAGLCLAASLPASAEDQAVASQPGLADEGIEVIVTASRGAEQQPIEVPQEVHSITRESLDQSEPVDVDNILRELPNVSLSPVEGKPTYWEEGFSIRGLGAQRVLTLTDGVRQTGQGIGYGGGNMSLYDPYSIEKIEVIKGPGSVLYGTDAFGGVVNVITRQPKKRDSFGTNGGARYSYDTSRDMNRGGAYLDFGDECYDAVFGGGYTNAGRPNLPDDMEVDNGSYRNWAFWGKTDFYFTGDTKLRFLGDINSTQDILMKESSITLPIAVFGAPGSMEMVSSPFNYNLPLYRRSLLGVELLTEKVSSVVEEVKSGIYWGRLSRQFHREAAYYPTGTPGFAGPPSFVDTSASIETTEVNTDDKVDLLEWQWQSRLKLDEHMLTVGLDFGNDRANEPESETYRTVAVAGPGPVNGPSRRVDRVRADAVQNRLGIYAQDQYGLGDFIFTPGARFDYVGVKDDASNYDDDLTAGSGSLGTVARLSEEQSLFLNLGTGFRAPDMAERFQDGVFNLGGPNRIVGKVDLDPERAWSAEMGTKGYYKDFSFETAGFYNRIEDFIGLHDLGYVDYTATQQYQNLGDVELFGGEALATYDLSSQFQIYGNAGRTWSPNRESIDLPDWAFNYGVRYLQPLGLENLKTLRTALNFRTLLESDQKTAVLGRTKFPDNNSFTVVDLLVSVELGGMGDKKGKLLAGMRNMFDQVYREPFFPEPQTGRSAYFGVEVWF